MLPLLYPTDQKVPLGYLSRCFGISLKMTYDEYPFNNCATFDTESVFGISSSMCTCAKYSPNDNSFTVMSNFPPLHLLHVRLFLSFLDFWTFCNSISLQKSCAASCTDDQVPWPVGLYFFHSFFYLCYHVSGSLQCIFLCAAAIIVTDI